MEIYFECLECNNVEPIKIAALSARGFDLVCSVCETRFTFRVVAVEHNVQRTGLQAAATLSGFYNCKVCGKEKCVVPGICDDCLKPPTDEEIKSWDVEETPRR